MSSSSREHTQWQCPPLRAWISLRQCDANRRRVRVAGDGDERAKIWLGECVKCSGVEWWSKQTGRGPRELAPDVLRAQARVPATVAERFSRFDRPGRKPRAKD